MVVEVQCSQGRTEISWRRGEEIISVPMFEPKTFWD